MKFSKMNSNLLPSLRLRFSSRNAKWQLACGRAFAELKLRSERSVQIYYRAFDNVFFRLPADLQKRIERKIDDLALQLDTFPHERLTNANRFRLRVGDYRVIYTFDLNAGLLYLLAVDHRREIYRKR